MNSTRSVFLVRALLVGVSLLSLWPMARLVTGWVEYANVVGRPLEATPPRGFDGVRWVNRGDEIQAAYVFPSSPAYDAGLRDGAVLRRLDYQSYTDAAEVERLVERATGTVLAYDVVQGEKPLQTDVPIAEYPTFLYPINGPLWIAAGWGFALVALLHMLALLTVLPLVPRSRRAGRAGWLIAAALAWVGGNLMRYLTLTLAGPPGLLSLVAQGLFDALTLVALTGWVLFPVLLLRQVLLEDRALALLSRPVRPVITLPALALGAGLAGSIVAGRVGPLPPDAFTAPILFYVCVFVSTACGLSLWRSMRPLAESRTVSRTDPAPAPIWNQAGSAAVLVLAVLGALFVGNALPSFRGEDDVAAGWFVTTLQLFSLLPVSLVSLAALRYGRFEAMLARSVAYLTVLGALFLLVAGGAALLDTFAPGRLGALGLAAWVVIILAMAERFSPWLRERALLLIRGDRQRARRRLDRLGDRMRLIMDPEKLAEETITATGEALGVQSGLLFLQVAAGTPDERWVSAPYHREPPYFTEQDLQRVWADLRAADAVWARNDELSAVRLPEADAQRLRTIGVALVVPVSSGRAPPTGLLVLGRRQRRLGVYTLEDVEMLRALCAQLALALERITLLARETALIRKTAEAKLVALRAQINPHFLFNALNTIAAQIAEHPDDAEETVQKLAGLFRDVLQASGEATVPLRDEMRLVRRYLAVEQARFGGNLEVNVDVDEASEALEVPAFAVQTLVENAVKHGIERKRGGGALTITACTEPEALRVIVSDTGPGIPALLGQGGPPDPSPHDDGAHGTPAFFGTGLRNVADRLYHLHGRTDLLTFTSTPEGTTATLRIPSGSPQTDIEGSAVD